MNPGDQFFVLGSDGLKHGPANFSTLQAWANEGRLLATSIVFDSQGNEYTASQILPQLFGSRFNAQGNRVVGSPTGPQKAVLYPGQPGQQNVVQNTSQPGPPTEPPAPGTYVPPTQGYMDPYQQSPDYFGNQMNQRNSFWDNIFLGNGYGGGWSGYGGGRGYGGGWNSFGWILALLFCCNIFCAVFAIFFAHRALLLKVPIAKAMVAIAYSNFFFQLCYTYFWHFHR